MADKQWSLLQREKGKWSLGGSEELRGVCGLLVLCSPDGWKRGALYNLRHGDHVRNKEEVANTEG